jgi:type I restriction enzyme M protein
MKRQTAKPKAYKVPLPGALVLSEGYDSEYALQLLVQSCHNLIWEKHGYDPAKAFDEFSKLIFAKFCDEKSNVSDPVFKLRFAEDPHHLAGRVRQLFSKFAAKPEFRDIFESRQPDRSDVQLHLDDFTIAGVAQKLSGLSLTSLAASSASPEMKGTVYEKFIGNTFRGELGQFFTHRELVSFMIQFIDITPDNIIYDPSCGSGGFLVQAIKFIRENYLEKESPRVPAEASVYEYSRRKIFGTDINDRAARTAKLNILMHGGCHMGVHHVNALLADEQAPSLFTSIIRTGSVDVILANPPFAGYEKEPDVLRRFHLGLNGLGSPTSVTREVLFLERIVTLLKVGGRAGIVIPQGIFTNRKLLLVRDFLRANTKILAVIELPDWAFIPSGTSVRGSILFVERCSRVPANYSVFMKRVDHIGFTSTGRPDPQNDLDDTIREYRRRDRRFLVPISEVSKRLDAKFYQPEHREIIELFNSPKKHPLVELDKVGRFISSSVNPRKDPEREYLCIETGDLDPDTYAITPKPLKGHAFNYSALRPVRQGDILISRRRPYRGAIARASGEIDGSVAITEFSVFRPHQEYDQTYILEVLRSPSFIKLLTIYSTGEMSGRISEGDLKKLKIPIPPKIEQARVGAYLAEERKRLTECLNTAARIRQSITQTIEGIVAGT